MGNYIADHRDELSVRHYIRKAGTEFYWFDFSYNKFREYQEQFGIDFCLVIYGSEDEDDAYIMPYKDLQEFFSIDSLESNRARWIGNIKDDVVHLSGGKSISVAAYYNITMRLISWASKKLTNFSGRFEMSLFCTRLATKLIGPA